MKKGFCYLLAVLAIASCKKDDTTTGAGTGNTTVRNIIDTAYGSDAQQKMDIYLPAGRTKDTKTFVLIHGGSWTSGSKSELTAAVPQLQTLFPGYAFINVDYRLAGNGVNLFPTQENDVKAAINLLQQNADQFNISKNIITVGFSAGGQLALLHAYKNDPDKNVKAVVDFYGPTNLPVLWNDGLLYQLLFFNAIGKTYDQDPAIYKSSTPVYYITAQSPPTIILQGGADNVVPPAQSTLLSDSLTSFKVPHQLVVYPSEAHGWTGNNLLDSYQKVKAFVEQYVK